MGAEPAVVRSPPPSLDATLRALADGTRRAILELVRNQALSVGEIAGQVEASQQATSHHLGVLRHAGLVAERHEGTRHLFVVRTDGFGVVHQYLGDFWPNRLSALKWAAEGTAHGKAEDTAPTSGRAIQRTRRSRG